MFNYTDFTSRNIGYLSTVLQERIRRTSLLIAGCGVGSVFAEVAVRLGFENITLVDGDTVALHNLNRQAFTNEDVDKLKVESLSKRLRAINPQLNLHELPLFINSQNVRELVAKADIVFDTIDFIDLSAIIALHDESTLQKKPIISAMNIGWGAGMIYFPIGGQCSFRSLFDLPAIGPVDSYSYTERFTCFLAKIADKLPEDVNIVVNRGLQKMADGRPCPMAQVAAAAHCMAGLAGTIVMRILSDLPIAPAPKLIYLDLGKLCQYADVSFEKQG